MKTLSIILQEARAASGLTQSEAARRIGISQKYLQFLENGDRTNPSEAIVRNCISAYNLDTQTADELLAAAGVVTGIQPSSPALEGLVPKAVILRLQQELPPEASVVIMCPAGPAELYDDDILKSVATAMQNGVSYHYLFPTDAWRERYGELSRTMTGRKYQTQAEALHTFLQRHAPEDVVSRRLSVVLDADERLERWFYPALNFVFISVKGGPDYIAFGHGLHSARYEPYFFRVQTDLCIAIGVDIYNLLAKAKNHTPESGA